MQVASFLAPPGAAAPGVAAGQFSNPLNASIEHEVPSNWCWAAVTSAIVSFYASSRQIGQVLSPCQVATNCWAGYQCCPAPTDSHDPRNKPFGLEGALNGASADFSYLAGDAIAGNIDFDSVAAEIDGGRPVCALISWDGDTSGVGHYILIVGYVRDGQKLYVLDNENGDGLWLFKTVCKGYHTNGTWDTTFKTQAEPKL